MELKRRLNPKYVFGLIYFLCFGIFLRLGFEPAEATVYDVTTELSIPSINLVSDVATLKLNNHRLDTPDYIVGSFSRANNKTLLIGHSSSVFKDLKNVKVGEPIIYDESSYRVTDIKLLEKDDIDMNTLLSSEEVSTLVLMTCAGESLANQDATHRLIITAEVE